MLQLPVLLHIPDGFLSAPVSALFWALTIAIVAVAVRRTNETLEERTVPLMGVMAAFIFAAQMMNFPVAGGTSGHLLGGALAAIVLGPWAAVIVMASVIGVQALVFQDGGLAVMGANIFNMGILTAFVGYAFYRGIALVGGQQRPFLLAGTAVAAWSSVMLAALLTSAELALSGTSPWSTALPAMMGVHVFIGIGEALISVGAVAFILAARPDLLGVRVASRQLVAATVKESAS
jgi:cobalt/nickel transport system permease protein